ncbi:hypothetical protein D3C79_1010410 [compost metagenome]
MHKDQACAGGKSTGFNLLAQRQQRLAGVQRLQRHAGLGLAGIDKRQQRFINLGKAAATGFVQTVSTVSGQGPDLRGHAMVQRYRQSAMDRMSTTFSQYQPR